MMKKIFYLLLITILPAQGQDAIALLENMVNTINSTNALSITMTTSERFGDEMREEKSLFKIQANPLKIYFKQEYPLKNFEALYREGENNNEVLFAPNGFPWVSFSLPPNGDRMRVTHHHPIMHAGYHHTAAMVSHILKKYAKTNPDYFVYEGLVKINGILCQKVSYTNLAFSIEEYEVQQGENLHTIGDKLFVNDYMILELNPEIKDYLDVKEGDLIKIPSDYSSKMIFYIEKTSGVPKQIKTYDQKGLFESYLYDNIVLNAPFNANTFSTENKDYGF